YLLEKLYFFKSVSAYTIFISLFLIFLPGDLTFTFVASFIATKLKPILDKTIYQTATNEDIEKFEKESNTCSDSENNQENEHSQQTTESLDSDQLYEQIASDVIANDISQSNRDKVAEDDPSVKDNIAN
ncbi:MAG TPA: hypothetical protein PLZ09_04680, partial [Clostridia bacterium]|nr:hypothetical protein [Clostridia bacterium]